MLMAMQPRIIPRHNHAISRRQLSPNALRTLYRLHDHGFVAYLVGGCVRDILLERTPKDFDIVTDATPNQIKRLFRNCRLIGRRFRLAHLHFQDEILEVSTFRAGAPEDPEDEEPPTRHQRHLKDDDGMVLRDNVFGTPEEDALRRDFTINALAYSIADFSVIDYADGLNDLERRLIRPIGDPTVRFTEDPVRMLRAIRFAASLGFSIEPDTWEALKNIAPTITRAAPARLYEELLKLFLLGNAAKTFDLLEESGLLTSLLPSLSRWLYGTSERRMLLNALLKQIDLLSAMGEQVSPPLFLALIFGPLLDHDALMRHRNGLPRQQSLDAACASFLEDMYPTVRIPARLGGSMRSILALQPALHKTPPRRPHSILSRPGCSDAITYLRITAEITGENREESTWWQSFISDHASSRPPEQETDGGPSRRKRRRRRKRKTTPLLPG